MTTYSVRCRNAQCRHRRVSTVHPDQYIATPRCAACGLQRGWRIEQRTYNKKKLCNCSGPAMLKAQQFPHKTTHHYCDQHPKGYYNQARHMGIPHDEIPVEFGGGLTPDKEEELCRAAKHQHPSQNNQESIV